MSFESFRETLVTVSWYMIDLMKTGTFKKNRKLEEHSDLPPETENIEVFDIMAVQEDSAGRRLPEAVECSEKSGLAAATWAYDSDDHSFWDVHAQLIQYDSSSSSSCTV